MRIFALMSEKSDIEIAIICQWDNQAIELLYDKYYRAFIIAKTICTNFQNEMCIFPHFFAVRLPAWNII